MLQVVATAVGGYDVIKVREVSPRLPGPSEVQVDVKCCGINFFDIYICQGLSPEVKPPCVLGLECAGVVAATGVEVKDIQVGDRVLVHCPEGGALSQSVTVEQSQILVLPANDVTDFRKAACLTINYLTAYFTVCELGGMRDGYSIFIQGAAGGVGWAATQIARMYKNVIVFGTASAHKHAALRDNGVDYPLTYDQDIKKEIRKVCPKGVTIVLENMAGESFNKSQEYIHSLGKVIVIGAKNMISGEKRSLLSVFLTWWKTKNVSVYDLIMKNKCVAGFNLSELSKTSTGTFREGWKEIVRFYQEKRIDPRIDSVYSMKEVDKACRRMCDRKNVGKILVEIRD